MKKFTKKLQKTRVPPCLFPKTKKIQHPIKWPKTVMFSIGTMFPIGNDKIIFNFTKNVCKTIKIENIKKIYAKSGVSKKNGKNKG